MNQFKDLKIWQDAINLGVEIYKLTKLFPSDEKFGLVSQMNRCAVSISSNIAEGAGRNNKKEFRQFLGIAQGSACELESQLIISQKLNFITENNLNKQT
jgi:four helix bundle protein